MPRTFKRPWEVPEIKRQLPSQNAGTGPRTVLCFSGGGIKGAFEVGALYYLTKFWTDLNVVGAVGTSTGAFNAMAVAAMKDRAANMMVETYLRADEFSDFFDLTQQFRSIQMQLVPVGLEVDPITFDIDGPNIRQLVIGLGVDVAVVAGTAFLTLSPVAPLLAAAIVFRNDANKMSILTRAVNNLGQVNGLFTKTPILTKIRNQLGDALMNGSLLPLRMYMVRYNDGELVYMKEDGEVYDATSHQRQRYAFANRQDRLMAGADASSAIPFFFEPVEFRIQGSQGVHLFVDGGVRENMPLVGAKEMGAERIVSIVCTFADVTRASSNPSILSTMLRTLDIFQSESLTNELNPPYGFNDTIQRVYIHAETKVLGPKDSFNVDPGLLRIMMDDGYMTAWEGLNLHKFPGNEDQIQANRREITELRRAIWGMERSIDTTAIGPVAAPAQTINGNAVRNVRAQKGNLANLAQRRYQMTADSSSLPEFVVNGQTLSSFRDWWTKFERHARGVQGSLVAYDPWGTLPFCGVRKGTAPQVNIP